MTTTPILHILLTSPNGARTYTSRTSIDTLRIMAADVLAHVQAGTFGEDVTDIDIVDDEGQIIESFLGEGVEPGTGIFRR